MPPKRWLMFILTNVALVIAVVANLIAIVHALHG
jgi:hypothetical protein